MGTTVVVLAPAAQLDAAGMQVRALFTTWEATLSRFDPQSDLSRCNAQAGQPVVVSDLMLRVLDRALEAATVTNGIFDPTLGTQMRAIGYATTFAMLPRQQPMFMGVAQQGGGWRDIIIDRQHHTIQLPVGVGLDFGGIAKGMAVDAAIGKLTAAGIAPALVNAGGDLAIQDCPDGMDGWPIAIPSTDDAVTVPLKSGALATSSILSRRWQQGDLPRHHLVDPRIGTSVGTDILCVSVAASECAIAEVAAKVALILGRDAGVMFLRHYGLAASLVFTDGTRLTLGAWPIDR